VWEAVAGAIQKSFWESERGCEDVGGACLCVGECAHVVGECDVTVAVKDIVFLCVGGGRVTSDDADYG